MSSSILEHLDLIDAVCDLDIGVCENSLSNFNMRVDFPGDARRKESACQCRRHKRHGFNLWVRKIPWNKKCQKKKEMSTHSSILAWKIPWTEETGKLQSMGWQRLDMTERLSTRTQVWEQPS